MSPIWSRYAWIPADRQNEHVDFRSSVDYASGRLDRAWAAPVRGPKDRAHDWLLHRDLKLEWKSSLEPPVLPDRHVLFEVELRMRTLIIMIAASTVGFAQGNGSAAQPQNHSIRPDAHAIVGPSIAATDRSWRARIHYTYLQRDEDRRLDSHGVVKSDDVEVSAIIFVNGVPFEQLVEHNGRPPSAEEQRKQKDKLDKLKRETREERVARLRQEEENNTSLIREVPLAFDFKQIGEEVVNGRPAYVLQATPHPGYRGRGQYGAMFSKVKGKLWVDKEHFGWVKVDGQVIQPFSIGLFLARVLPGSHITMEQTRVGDWIWMPKHIEVRAAAKIFFIKSLIIDKVLTYSGYRLDQTGITAIPGG